LVPTKGQRFSAIFPKSVSSLWGKSTIFIGIVEGVQYIPLPRESTLAGRLVLCRSTGDQPQTFRLGGVDRVRAVPSGDLVEAKTNIIFREREARLRLKYLDARTKFLYPDFYFKAAYLFYSMTWDTVGTRARNVTVERQECGEFSRRWNFLAHIYSSNF